MLTLLEMNLFERFLLLNLVFLSAFFFVRDEKCPVRQQKKTIFFVLWSLALIFFLSQRPIFFCVGIFCGFLISNCFILIEKAWFQRQSGERLPLFLLRLSLSLKTGFGLRESLRREAALEPKYFQDVIQLMLFSLETRAHFSTESGRLRQFYCLLEQIDKEPAKIVTRIELFRQKVSCEMQFQAKVAQILSQPRAQAVVVLILYAALILFLHSQFRDQQWVPYFYVSAPIFSLGVCWIFLIGRKYKWKV